MPRPCAVAPCAAAGEDTRPPSVAPVLVYVSLRDRVIDIPAAMGFPPDDADIFTTKKAGHVLTLDVDWEKRAKKIAAFALR